MKTTTLLAALLGTLACICRRRRSCAICGPSPTRCCRIPTPAEWLSWRRTLNHWGYSPLTQVDKRNVAQLRLVWTRPLAQGVQEGTPLVHDGVMFFPNPNDITQAIDAATGDLIWEYRRPVQEDNNDYIPFPSINRNLAIYGNLILDNGADNFAYALDARTGALVWETQILDYRRGAQHSSGPIVANGKVISGRSCEPEGGPEACVLTAFDAQTGKEVWRTRTIPRPDEPGGDTWGDIPYEERRHVGLWMVPSFDPELNRIYVGTSVTSPAPKFMLAGNDEQYLYHNSTLAIDADTGKIVWYLQHNVDHWDLDHPFERILDRHGRRSRRDGRRVDQSARSLRPGAQGHHGRARQDGARLHDRPRERAIPVGAPDRRAERHRSREHGVRRRRRQRREAVHGPESRDARVPEPDGRQELSRRRVQPRHEAHVHAAAEHLHDARPRRRHGRASTSCMRSAREIRSRRGSRTSARSKRSPSRRAARRGSASSAPARRR